MPKMSIRTLVYATSLVVSGELTPYPWPAFVLAAGGSEPWWSRCFSPFPHSGKRHPDWRALPFSCAGERAKHCSPNIVAARSRLDGGAIVLDRGEPILVAGRARYASCLAS